MTTPGKSFNIDKKEVYEADLRVRSNGGAAGVDGMTLDEFETDLKGNLYRIWNQMSSRAYFPPPVRAVPIPKKSGGQRILGVPTVADRVAGQPERKLLREAAEDLDAASSDIQEAKEKVSAAVGGVRALPTRDARPRTVTSTISDRPALEVAPFSSTYGGLGGIRRPLL